MISIDIKNVRLEYLDESHDVNIREGRARGEETRYLLHLKTLLSPAHL